MSGARIVLVCSCNAAIQAVRLTRFPPPSWTECWGCRAAPTTSEEWCHPTGVYSGICAARWSNGATGTPINKPVSREALLIAIKVLIDAPMQRAGGRVRLSRRGVPILRSHMIRESDVATLRSWMLQIRATRPTLQATRARP